MATDWWTVGSTDDGDRVSRVLADERRRLVLSVVAGAETPIALECLASLVARREADWGRAQADYLVDQVHLALYHRDVPKLADAGVIDWDRTRDVVSPGPGFQEALPLAEAIAEAAGGHSRDSG